MSQEKFHIYDNQGKYAGVAMSTREHLEGQGYTIGPDPGPRTPDPVAEEADVQRTADELMSGALALATVDLAMADLSAMDENAVRQLYRNRAVFHLRQERGL